MPQFRVATLGKTLGNPYNAETGHKANNPGFGQINRHPTLAIMLISFFQRLLPQNTQVAAQRNASPAAQLMERAEASAGRNPRRAAELRSAAMAYLGVVR